MAVLDQVTLFVTWDPNGSLRANPTLPLTVAFKIDRRSELKYSVKSRDGLAMEGGLADIDADSLKILESAKSLLDKIKGKPLIDFADSTTTEDSESTETSESSEDTESSEGSENKEGKDGTEESEGSEDSESSEDSERTEESENSENTENSETSEHAEGEMDQVFGPLINPKRTDWIGTPVYDDYLSKLGELRDVLKDRYSRFK